VTVAHCPDAEEKKPGTPKPVPSTVRDEAARVRLGASTNTEPAVLRDLADDTSVTVRAALALNPAAPLHANQALVLDADERVRILLARKLAILAPRLSADDQRKLQRETWETLSMLVADEAVRVRTAIAEAVKDIPDGPRALILRLAQDAALPVSDPVIRLSPLLTTEDLLSLLANAPGPGTAVAVAHRPRIEEAVSDAIAQSANTTAIRAMLTNPSAQIREATLDALVLRSVEHPEWHEPLVRRPSLSTRAAQMLSSIVTTQLLEVLASRVDLSPVLAEELRRGIAAQLTPAPAPAAEPADTTADEALIQARDLAARGKLSEAIVLEAARRGEARYATALLAVAAGKPVSVVDRAASLRSAKGLVSLVWNAGFTMRLAVALQGLLGRLPPNGVLGAGPSGNFPLAVEEMRWQLEFLARMER
jgi:uncharacterized protein (DUF2336 family)